MTFAFQVKQVPSQEEGSPVANSKIKGSPPGQCKALPENEGPKSMRSSPGSFVIPCSSLFPFFSILEWSYSV